MTPGTAAPRAGGSIRRRLVARSFAVLATALAALLVAVIWINAWLSARHRDAAVESIRAALVAKGMILVSNNSQALEEMVPDNAFGAVAKLVATTVRDDGDVVYGVFMDAGRQPWVNAGPDNPEGAVAGAQALEDTASLWAARLAEPAWRAFPGGAGAAGRDEVYEFAAPVSAEGRILGVIRYGLTTAGMHAAIAEADRSSRQALWRTVSVLVLLGGLAALLSYLATRGLAARLTQPILVLQSAANAIAKGDYGRAIAPAGDDEVGLLAADFETMRLTVKAYTERLQDMVAEKVREIRDILDNIEQGLFTVGLDGKVNPDYARSTNAILGVDDVGRRGLGELFRIDAEKLADWMEWLEVVRGKQESMRWDKLARLAPVRELELPGPPGPAGSPGPAGPGGPRHIEISYQRMFDRERRLSKLMVLATDVTEARRVEKLIREEKERHEHEVKAILGIVRYALTLPDFLADAEARLQSLESMIGRTEEDAGRAAMLRDLHTLKGTSATYGFEALAALARDAEEALLWDGAGGGAEAPPGAARPGLPELLRRMGAALEDIRSLARRLSGQGETASVPVAEHKLRHLRRLCEAFEKGSAGAAPQAMRELLEACRALERAPLARFADKYRAMLERLGEKLGKRLEFEASPGDLEISPHAFAALEEPLTHLLRNAADHGIETTAERILAGKPAAGRIELALGSEDEAFTVSVRDDGRGIDPERVGEKAVAMGLVDAAALARMEEKEKLDLVFASGLTTRAADNDVSGRGVGMDAVAAWVRREGGRIGVESQPGRGTKMTLWLPAAFIAK